MAVHQETIEVVTRGPGLTNITSEVAAVVRASGIDIGCSTTFILHTSASLIISENADPAVTRDLQRWFADLAPESRNWEHDDEGPDDMPAHAKAAISKTSETIVVSRGELVLGTWQGLYLWEHRARGSRRRLIVHVAGEPAK